MVRFIGFAVLLIGLTTPTLADIYQWEYVDPSEPSLGKQQSTTLAPDGDGLMVTPGQLVLSKDLTKAYLHGSDLSGTVLAVSNFTDADLSASDLTDAHLTDSDFTNADLRASATSGLYVFSTEMKNANLSGANFSSTIFSYANLTNADLTDTNLTGADLNRSSLSNAKLYGAKLTGAVLHGTSFYSTTDSGFTAQQLYSTASYAQGDIAQIDFGGNDLSGWNFIGQCACSDNFRDSKLTGANFTDALLNESSLVGADLANAVLSNASLKKTDIADASFYSTTDSGFTAEQFYSTFNYQTGNIVGVNLGGNNLAGWNFAGKNLTDSMFVDASMVGSDLSNANLNGADLTGSDLRNADLSRTSLSNAYIRGASLRATTDTGLTAEQFYSTANYTSGDLADIDLSENDLSHWVFIAKELTGTQFGNAKLFGADARTAVGMDTSGADIRSFIQADGAVEELGIQAGETLLLSDYNSDEPLPLSVQQGMSMDGEGSLRILFEDDTWGSLIAFEAGVPVELAGTLELRFAVGVDYLPLVGTTYRLFDWSGVMPIGSFDEIFSRRVSSATRLGWDTTHLYTAGTVTFLGVVPEPSTLALTGFGLLLPIRSRK